MVYSKNTHIQRFIHVKSNSLTIKAALRVCAKILRLICKS